MYISCWERKQYKVEISYSKISYLKCNKYSFVYPWQLVIVDTYLSSKPLHISKAGTKIFIGGFHTKMRVVDFIPFFGRNTVKRTIISEVILIFHYLQAILLPCDTIFDSAVFRMSAHDICASTALTTRM